MATNSRALSCMRACMRARVRAVTDPTQRSGVSLGIRLGRRVAYCRNIAASLKLGRQVSLPPHAAERAAMVRVYRGPTILHPGVGVVPGPKCVAVHPSPCAVQVKS